MSSAITLNENKMYGKIPLSKDVPDGYVLISIDALKMEHDTLIKRVHELRAILGYKPLLTGKQVRRLQERIIK